MICVVMCYEGDQRPRDMGTRGGKGSRDVIRMTSLGFRPGRLGTREGSGHVTSKNDVSSLIG